MISEFLSRFCKWLAGVLDRGLSEESKAGMIRAANEQLLKEMEEVSED